MTAPDFFMLLACIIFFGVPILLFLDLRYKNKRKKQDQERAQRHTEQLLAAADAASYFINACGYKRIYSPTSIIDDKQSLYSAYVDNPANIIVERPWGKYDYFDYSKYGVSPVFDPDTYQFYQYLAQKVNGKLNVKREHVSGFIPGGTPTSISSTFTPGGGTGYTINTTRGESVDYNKITELSITPK